MMRTIIALMAAMLAAAPALAQQKSQASPCATDSYRQFDFWIGHWDVYPTGKDKLVAHSLIEKLYGGCAIRENWMPLKGQAGGSLSNYDRHAGKWRQAWVDASGTRVDFFGGMADGKMVLTGWWPEVLGPAKGGLVRMTYSKRADGAVRQFGQVSTDGGKSWKPAFDFTYKPSA